MSRLIDADELKRRAQKVATEAWKMKLTAKIETTLNQFIDWINDAPTIEERKTGKWKKSYADHEAFGIRPFFRYCSECHEATVHPYNFCPNCGADMRGDKRCATE